VSRLSLGARPLSFADGRGGTALNRIAIFYHVKIYLIGSGAFMDARDIPDGWLATDSPEGPAAMATTAEEADIHRSQGRVGRAFPEAESAQDRNTCEINTAPSNNRRVNIYGGSTRI
jgi:hypothetical protein